jgi:hypothetical protein
MASSSDREAPPALSSAAAVADGLRRVGRAPAILFGMYATTLLVALPLAIALEGMLADHLGTSLAGAAVVRGGDVAWWQEFSAQATGLGTTFVPSIIGFGAVLQDLSGLLDNLPLAATISGVTAAWLLLWSFLAGGIVDRYARNRATRARGFCGACGAHFPALLRLGLFALVAYWILFAWIHPLIFETAYGRLTHEVAVERTAIATRLAGYVIFGVLLLLVNVVIDYARIRIVVEDRRSAAGGLLAGLRFVRRHAGAVAGVYVLNGLLFVVLIVVYALVAPGATRSVWVALAIGQTFILLRHVLKLTFYASETALFQSRLAHAAYAAAPMPAWPESPAAEAILQAPMAPRP